MKKCLVCKIVALVGGLGALNWGLVAFFNINLVDMALGGMPLAAKIAYGAVGVAGVILLISVIRPCPMCKTG